MDIIAIETTPKAPQYGRQASATVHGQRRSGYLIGNKFVYSDIAGKIWLECGPGEFQNVKIWRK